MENREVKDMEPLHNAALIAVRDCMAAKAGESLLVITDEPERKIGYALWEAAKELGTEAMLLEIIPRETHGQEPPEPIAHLMKIVDVVLCPTSRSLTHTDARREASQAGVRIATLPGISEDCMIRTLNADYKKIAYLTMKLNKILDEGKEAHVTTPAGTDITLPIEGMKGHPDTGLVHNPGDMSNLPAGEAYLAPVEGASQGVIVVDGSMAGVGLLKESVIKIVVKDGYAEEISGDREADRLKELLRPFGRSARNIAELGIGTNYMAQITGLVLEDEKAIGTVHIALGDNISMGGSINVPSHLDGILKNPTLKIDGKLIMKDGEIVV